ncbi:hypothetical protein NESM_000314100 [Novymonas esmeraldas]|uniref:Uncharacterized protein n=1 Tax=Novymonas esmeraldas TaxID=1808958 RepID=A0AAW0EKU7_9TRYP
MRDARGALQACLSTTEATLPALVAGVVEEVARLRMSVRSAEQVVQHRDHELAALATLLQEASAALPDSAPFLPAGAPLSVLHKCSAYAKECARLAALEREVGGILRHHAATPPLDDDGAPLPLGELASELQRERVRLRTVEVPKLHERARVRDVELVVAEERASRAALEASEAASRVRSLYSVEQRDLRCLVEAGLARQVLASEQSAQMAAQQRRLLSTHEPLVAAVLELTAAQDACRRELAGGAVTTPDGASARPAPPEALSVALEEAKLVPRLVRAHAAAVASCAALRAELASAAADRDRERAQHRSDMEVAATRSTELTGQLTHIGSFVDALRRHLLSEESREDADGSACLPRLVEAAARLARDAANDAAARHRLEEAAGEAAASAAALQDRCAVADAEAAALRATVRRHERHQLDEVQHWKAVGTRAAQAYDDVIVALSTPGASAGAAAAAAARTDGVVSEEQWTAAVHAVHATVADVARQTSIVAELQTKSSALQSRVAELTAALRDAETREGNLVRRVNTLVQSSGPLKAAVAAVAVSQDGAAESLEDVAIVTHAAVQLVTRQRGDNAQLLTRGKELLGEVDRLVLELRRAAEERDAAAGAAAASLEAHEALQRRLSELERRVHDTWAECGHRASTVLGAAESAPLTSNSASGCLDGMANVVEALAATAESRSAAEARLAAWKCDMHDREADNARTTAALATLWRAFQEHLLPLLVDTATDSGAAGRGGDRGRAATPSATAAAATATATGWEAVASATTARALPSEAETQQAVQTVVDAAGRLRRSHDELHEVYAALRGHFGGNAATAVTGMSGAPHAPPPVQREDGTASPRFDDTVAATLRLVTTVVDAKCSCTKDFLTHVAADVLGDTAACARVSFTALRPGAFAEWLRDLLAALQELRDGSARHRDRARRLPDFMDALVEVIHGHGGRVDVALFGAGGAPCLIADATAAATTAAAAVVAGHRDPTVPRVDDAEAREQAAILQGLETLLGRQEEHLRALAAQWQDVRAEVQHLSQEQVAAEETVLELRRRVQFKVQEDCKLEESLRELDVHLDQQARELALRYQADQDVIARRFTVLRDRIHATMRLPARRATPSAASRTPRRGASTPRS